MALTVCVHAEEFHLQANSSKHGDIPMWMISGNAPVLDGSFSEAEWGDYLITDMATPDTPYTYVEDSYNKLSHEEWLKKVFTPVRFYATYDDTYVYVCAVTEDKDHACVSSWEGDYADIRIWKKDSYDGKKIISLTTVLPMFLLSSKELQVFLIMPLVETRITL